MPWSWIFTLSQEQAEQLAGELRVSSEGTLGELQTRLKEKWMVTESVKPSKSGVKPKVKSEKSEVQRNVSEVEVRSDGAAVLKMRVKVVSDLVKNVPFLVDVDPENILKFMIRLKEVHDLNLVSDFELLSLTVGRTSGRVAQIVGSYLVGTADWKAFCDEILATFFPTRIRERF
jgi:hypothetical protein